MMEPKEEKSTGFWFFFFMLAALAAYRWASVWEFIEIDSRCDYWRFTIPSRTSICIGDTMDFNSLNAVTRGYVMRPPRKEAHP